MKTKVPLKTKKVGIQYIKRRHAAITLPNTAKLNKGKKANKAKKANKLKQQNDDCYFHTLSRAKDSINVIKAKRVLCLHGINLNMFGKRDPKLYGDVTLDAINLKLHELSKHLGKKLGINVKVECFQTNHEGEMVERIHELHIKKDFDAVIINCGAWTHYSLGIHDALAILKMPIIEIHMSNVHARDDLKGSMHQPMRHYSVISPLAHGVIAGFGLNSYVLGLRAALDLIS